MSCEPVCPCGCGAPLLVLDQPPPGETHLRRRVGEFHGFLADLIEHVERQPFEGGLIGSRWDVEGDPAGLRLAELWAYVAEGVAAYTEMTAGETYLPTAQDWTDLRRVAALVGFRPRPPIAAQGWVTAELDRGADPLVPAGTRVQAPGTPTRSSQIYEVAADTQLRSEWAGLTATWVPQPEVPLDRTIRFLGDPEFRPADRILFVLEQPTTIVVQQPGWFGFWFFLLYLWGQTAPASATPLALASVVGTSSELGTTVVKFDRDLDQVLASTTEPYAAYRVVATASTARRLTKVLQIPANATEAASIKVAAADVPSPVSANFTTVTLDRPIEDLSAHKLVAVVDWAGTTGACDVVEVKQHQFVDWEVAPGTSTRVSQLVFPKTVNTLKGSGPFTIYVLDRRVVAKHYVLPKTEPIGPNQLRLFPRPDTVPERITVGIERPAGIDWQVFSCSEAADQEDTLGDAPSGLIVDLSDGAPTELSVQAPASANLLRVHHGKTVSAVLGSGDATQARQGFTTPDAPIASDLDDQGTPVPSMLVRVAGLEWDEVPSLFGVGGAEVFSVRRDADGAETLEFGDGAQGARLPTGRGNVAATYRVGGGKAGEVESGAIEALLGNVRGVKKVRGAGPTEGGADQDDEQRLRRLAPTRARAFGRAVSAEDLVDLSLGYPGVTHAAVGGTCPPGCTCGATGLHLAFIRDSSGGPRAPLGDELAALSGYLDARRDATVPLCVCGGTVTRPQLTVALAADPRRAVVDVCAAVAAALADPDGDLGPEQRALGQPLDRSDVFAVIHRVTGVVGVPSLDVPGATGELGRAGAAWYELLVPSVDPVVTGAPA